MGTFLLILPLLFTISLADRGSISSMTGAHTSRDRLVGSNSCTWGPSYWCDGMKNAKECSAVNHCVQAVWKKQDEPTDASALCRWCDDLMDDIRELVAANTSKVAMRGYIKDGCRRIPDHSRRSTCVDEILTDLSEIRQMLSANIPDRTVCKTIGFCDLPEQASSPVKSFVPLTKIVAPISDNRNYCADCHHFFDDAKEIYIGNYTEDEFKQMLLQQCDQAGYAALTELCKTVIEEYWPQIYARLQVFFDPESVCIQLNFCEETPAIKRTWKLPFVPFSASSNIAKTPSISALPLDRMLLNLNLNAQTSSLRSPVAKKVDIKNDVQCVLCEFVMSYLDRILADNYTEAAIQSALAKVCSLMPRSIKQDCHSFIEQYAPAIFVILSNELDPAMVCQGIGLCQQKHGEEVGTTEVVCGKAGATCGSCTEVFQAVKTLLDDYDENARLAELIKSYCAFFPTQARDQCETAVATYVPYGLQMIAQLIKPVAVCEAVKLCPKV